MGGNLLLYSGCKQKQHFHHKIFVYLKWQEVVMCKGQYDLDRSNL